jgi:hypothetical protein
LQTGGKSAGEGDEFQLVSIRPVAAPTGSADGNWFRYRIAQGANLINGYRCGELTAVTADVEKLVVGLNERRLVKRGRVDLKPTRTAVREPTIRR